MNSLCKLLTLSALILSILTFSAQAQNKPSEQKTGSVLVFPYYTSNDNASADTLMSISNVATFSVNVHLYFMEGRSCQQADMSVFLTPNATITLQASSDIPMETGYLIAVATDDNGNLVANGGLTGSAFVKMPAGALNIAADEVRGNYGATAFNAYQAVAPANGELTLNFNGVVLDAMPTSFAVSVQSPATAVGQTIVMAGLSGSLIDSTLTGAAQVGTGAAYSPNEVLRSFTRLILGNCQSVTLLSNINPRLVGTNGLGLSGLITPGSMGLIRFSTAGSVGILITPRNNAGWSGIRNIPSTRTNPLGKLAFCHPWQVQGQIAQQDFPARTRNNKQGCFAKQCFQTGKFRRRSR
jgi:hypothetical protein